MTTPESVGRFYRVIVEFKLGKRIMPSGPELAGSRVKTELILFSTFAKAFEQMLGREPRGLNAQRRRGSQIYRLFCRVTEVQATAIMETFNAMLSPDVATNLVRECEERGTHEIQSLEILRVIDNGR